MSKREKKNTQIRDIYTGEILGEAQLSEARAIVKAYLLAGLSVEAVA
jgi:hypothetical protein